MSFLRGETDINVSIRKAASADETAPKRKHVRACVVYTWDHRNGRDFWNAVRLVPVQNDDVMCYKALIIIHKVIQEGHPAVLKEAQHHINWLQSLSKGGSWSKAGYGKLIDEYVRLLLHKLDFHRAHPAFNGTFEYEEYISLRSVDDPNEGYESIIDLMNLQDAIDDFQRLIFASVSARGRHQFGGSTECRVSSLTAMVTEAYGIYRFITSMLRALHTASDAEVLEPLRNRYYSQHQRLRNFLFDCTSLKYLVSLITIPELPQEPPNLFSDEGPALPKRPREHKTGESLAPSSTGVSATPMAAQPTGDWWQAGGAALAEAQMAEELRQQQLQAHEQQLAAQRAAEEQRALQAQQEFEAQQALMVAQQQAAQEEYARQLQQMQIQGQTSQMEQELGLLRSQQEEAQHMLQQYDARVQSLESDLAQINSLTQMQIDAKTEQLEAMQQQVDTWKSKYEALAKLYSQLRQEHLDLLGKHRKIQTKAASAQEAIDKREKLERDLKSKNLELADLIRERDRARYELDRARGQHSNETEKLERTISQLNDKIADGDRNRGADISTLSTNHARQLAYLEEKLGEQQKLVQQLGGGNVLREKDDEIDVLKETIVELEGHFKQLSVGNGNSGQLVSVLDAIMLSAAEQVQRALTVFDSPIEGGNPQATPPYVLTLTEKSSASAKAFSDSFTDYVAAEDSDGDPVAIITAATVQSGAISDVLTNVKGLSGVLNDDNAVESITYPAREAAASICAFYSSLHSDLLGSLSTDEKVELIIASHVDIQQHLQDLLDATEAMMPKTGLAKANLDKQVDGAMAHLADAVAAANSKLTSLMAKSHYGQFDRKVSEAILAAAVALTSAIAALIKAAADCQREIVAKGRQGESAEMYYKKNHRWTEGLISAARMVAGSTDILIETADGTLSGKSSPEELIVASREVASSTAQLVASSRAKADYMSKTQDQLDGASKSVTSACRSLVARVEEILAKQHPSVDDATDYSRMNPVEFKTIAMEQQVEVLKLEQQLTTARNKLFQIRKSEYAAQDED